MLGMYGIGFCTCVRPIRFSVRELLPSQSYLEFDLERSHYP